MHLVKGKQEFPVVARIQCVLPVRHWGRSIKQWRGRRVFNVQAQQTVTRRDDFLCDYCVSSVTMSQLSHVGWRNSSTHNWVVWGEEGKKNKTDGSIRLPVRARNKRKCEIFCFDLCRWTSLPPPPSSLSTGVRENTRLRCCVTVSRFFFCVKCRLLPRRGRPKEEHLSEKHARVTPYLVLMTAFSAIFFQCNGTKTQEWLGGSKVCWSVGGWGKKKDVHFVHLIFFHFLFIKNVNFFSQVMATLNYYSIGCWNFYYHVMQHKWRAE